MTDLLPCPFCGSKNVAQGASAERISVWCFCGARGPDVAFPEICIDPAAPIDECRALWNRRTAHSSGVKVKGLQIAGRLEEIAESSHSDHDKIRLMLHAASEHDRRLAFLSPTEAGVEGDAKPVAWQMREQNSDGNWTLWREVPEDSAAALSSQNRTDIEVRPLYAAPVSAPTHPSLLEECREVLEHVDYICGQWEKKQGASSLTIAVRTLLTKLEAGR